MGIHRDTDLYSLYGGKSAVKTFTAYAVSTFSKWSVDSKPLRGYCVESKELDHVPLIEVYTYPDSVRMWKLKTEDDYVIELTEDCEIYTTEGWMRVEDVELEDIIFVNGSDVPPYAVKENLKMLYVDKGKSQIEIGEMYGVSPRTIRSYVKKFELNRGDAGAKFGEENPNWRGVNVTKDGGYSRTHEHFGGQKKGVCGRCGFVGKTDIHHDDRNPVNIAEENLIELCVMCHKAEHLGAPVRWIRPARIVEKQYAGYSKTFGFKTSLNNVVANGFIVRFTDDGAVTRVIGKI